MERRWKWKDLKTRIRIRLDENRYRMGSTQMMNEQDLSRVRKWKQALEELQFTKNRKAMKLQMLECETNQKNAGRTPPVKQHLGTETS